MILICDKDASPRARNLQSLFLDLGYHAAVCAISEIKEYLPAWFIITFSDSFDDLRRAPYDHIFAVVIGNGFVNSALNAKRVLTTDEALRCATDLIKNKLKIDECDCFPFGVVSHSTFFSDFFIEIRGSIIPLTDIEMLIFKFIFFCSTENIYTTSAMIDKYCYSASAKKHRGNVIPVHIANINKKALKILGGKIIASMRHKGYYIDKT